MGKKIQNIKITNFSKKSSFFIETPKFKKFLNITKNKINLKPTQKEIESLNKLISIYEEKVFEEGNNSSKKSILIKPEFLYELNKFKKIEDINTNYGTQVTKIIEILNQEKVKISLKNIQKKYFQIYNSKKSLMTFSRILRNKLNLHFLKTTVKNPKLQKNLYKFMAHFFMKGVLRGLKLGLKFIYIDETGFQLSNNNFFSWRKKSDNFYGGAQTKLKERLNLLLAIDDENIIHSKILKKSIDHTKFKEFIEEMIDKIPINKKDEYMLIIDNAKYHLTEEIKEVTKKFKLKVLTNCPYLSNFNGIEYVFRIIKAELYKELIRNQKELKRKIISCIEDEKINKSITKIYLKELRQYKKFIEDNENENIIDLYCNNTFG